MRVLFAAVDLRSKLRCYFLESYIRLISKNKGTLSYSDGPWKKHIKVVVLCLALVQSYKNVYG